MAIEFQVFQQRWCADKPDHHSPEKACLPVIACYNLRYVLDNSAWFETLSKISSHADAN